MTAPLTDSRDTLAVEKEAQRRKRIAAAVLAGEARAVGNAARLRAIKRGLFPRFQRAAKGRQRARA